MGSTLKKFKSSKVNNFSLLPEEIQIKILTYDRKIMINSVYLNRYFNKLMTKFVKELPISKKEILNILFNMKEFSYHSKIPDIRILDKFIIYDGQYSEEIKITIYRHHKDDRVHFRKVEYLYPVHGHSRKKDCHSCFDEDADFIINNSHNLDFFLKYVIYKLRFHGYNYFNDKIQNRQDDDFIKNKLLKELDEKYQSLDKNDELSTALFNEYLLLQKLRYEQSYGQLYTSSENKLTDEYDMFNNMVKIREEKKLIPEKFNYKLYQDLCNAINEYNIDNIKLILYDSYNHGF